MLILSNLMSRLKLEERKGTKFEALILALILVALTISITTAWAGDTSRFNGQSAEAFFSSVDGCIETSAFISAEDTITSDLPGSPNSSSRANFSIFKFDFCNSIDLQSVSCFAPLGDQEFQVIGNKLDSAELNATLQCFDFLSMSSFDVVVDIHWTAIDDLIKSGDHCQIEFPGFKINARRNVTVRRAEVSGSVSDETTFIIPTEGSIMSFQGGSVVND